MLKNYFLTTLRNLRKNRLFSIINVSGLAIGISAALVIYMLVQYELSYDKFEKDRDRIYRIVTNMHFPDQDFKNAGAPGPLAAAVRTELLGIEQSTLFWTAQPTKVTLPGNEKKTFKKQNQIIYADENYFRFFKYEWLAGSADVSLNGLRKVVLTESRARTYFPYDDITHAVGQTITYDDTITATVTGIVKDLHQLTDFTFNEFISLETYRPQLEYENGWNEWGSVNSASQFFLKLQKGIDTAKVNKQIAELRKKHEKNAYLSTDHFLQTLGDIHFNSSFDAFGHRQAHKPTLYGLMAIALFLLLLGCINFINLTTAQAAQRAKEIGIRKTLGSSKKQLVTQFLSETFLLTLFAMILSIVISPWVLKLFSPFLPEGLNFRFILQPDIILFILVLMIVVTFLSGAYPALVLSGYRPVMVLKNLTYANTAQSRRVWVRKTLTVSQFVIAQFFIIAMLIVGKQIRFSLNKDMGFKKDAIINFRAPMNYQNPDNRQFVLLQKLKAIPGIQQLSLGGPPPASPNLNVSTMKFNKDGKDIETSVEVKQADTNYFNLYKIKFLAGRNLQQSDTLREYVINANYARFLGYNNPADIIGHTITRGSAKVPIVGVIADINTKSMHKAIQPLAFYSEGKYSSTFHVALPPKAQNTDNWQVTLEKIESAWKEVYPEEDFSYTFFDQSIAKFYEKEKQTSSLMNWCAGLAIFISCLGLLGLVIYTTTQRTKEIGVRKVLGASVTQIISLLSKDFMRLVILAFIIASPLAWWFMYKWLQDFAYRTGISWWIFALSGLSMLLIALITLSIQTIRAALTNPVKSLRTE